MELGARLGIALGANEGMELGARLGIALGANEGMELGARLGPELGNLLGIIEGLELGARLGTLLGSIDGVELGALLGPEVGGSTQSLLHVAGHSTIRFLVGHLTIESFRAQKHQFLVSPLISHCPVLSVQLIDGI